MLYMWSMSCRVFYVDDQEDIVWSTTKLLARKCPDLTVESFTEPIAALEALKQDPPDILVTDLRMEGMSGLELMVAARKVVSDLPVIVVTAYGGPDVTAALHGRLLVEYLEKPVRTESLIAAIDRLLVRGQGFSGAISLPMLPDLIQVYTLSLTTGALAIRRGGSSGTLWFDNGKIVHAVCGDRTGEPAVYEMLSWQGGEFSLDTETKPTERTITASWQEVLLEGCRLLDEAGRDGSPAEEPELFEEDFPSSQVSVPIDLDSPVSATASPRPSASVEKLKDSEENSPSIYATHPIDLVSLGVEPPTTTSAQSVAQLESSKPSTSQSVVDSQVSATVPLHPAIQVEKHLDQLQGIEGFIAAAMFDGTVPSLLDPGSGDPSISLGATVTHSAEFLAAIQGTSDGSALEDSITDIVITLGQQFHLIRPLSQREGEFLFLVLDRRQGDIAKARRQLARVEKLFDT